MPLQLEDMKFGDGAAYANTYISAFSNDAYSRASFPGVTFDERVAGVISRWPKRYGEDFNVYKKVVDTDTGELISWIKIEFENTDIDPSRFAPADIPEVIPEETIQQRSTPPKDKKDDTYRTDFLVRAEATHERALGKRPAIVINLFGTHPKAQRRGAGTLLMAWVIELADQEGLPCWVTGSPAATPLYKKFGFQVVEEIVVPLPASVGGGTYTHTCMIREPKTP